MTMFTAGMEITLEMAGTMSPDQIKGQIARELSERIAISLVNDFLDSELDINRGVCRFSVAIDVDRAKLPRKGFASSSAVDNVKKILSVEGNAGKIKAIKQWRADVGSDLKNAKDEVEKIMVDMGMKPR